MNPPRRDEDGSVLILVVVVLLVHVLVLALVHVDVHVLELKFRGFRALRGMAHHAH